MDKHPLIIKSDNNKSASDWAIENDYYEVATSRLYYSLYQYAKHIWTKAGQDFDQAFTDYRQRCLDNGTKCQGEHVYKIQKLVELAQANGLNRADRTALRKMNGLRAKRNIADYNSNAFSMEEFQNSVEPEYQLIYDKLSKLNTRIGG